MSENYLNSIVKRIPQGLQNTDKLVCIISKYWFQSLINYLSGSSHPGKIETPKSLEDHMPITQEDFNDLIHVFSGGSNLLAFLINGTLDYSLLDIQVCINDSIWKTYQISAKLSVSRLKNYLCDCEDLETHKVRIRLIEETQGTIAYRALPETCTLETLNLQPGIKISLDKPIKRLVKFVESEDEEDKVVEICVKHKNSTGKGI